MTTSRTGTATWKRIAAQARAAALEQGLMRCPLCGVGLDWEYSKRPNSPEVDHIIPHSQGGKDHIDAVRVICRRCNQSLGGSLNKRRPRPVITTTDLDASPIW